MNKNVSGPSSSGPSTPAVRTKSGKSGKSVRFAGGASVNVTNLTSETSSSPINESAKNINHSDNKTTNIHLADRSVGFGEGADSSDSSDSPSSTTTQQTTTTTVPTEKGAVQLAEEAVQFGDPDELLGAGVPLKKDTRETDRKRRKGDSRDDKAESEEEGAESRSRIENIEGAEEREGGTKEDNRQQDLLKLLEKMAREGQITGLQDIINVAWGKKGVYEDVTEAYDGLRAAQKHFDQKDEEVLKNLSNSTRAAGDILYKENAPDIKAGYLFGPGTDETISYREHVIRFEKVSDSFKMIMEKAQGTPRLFSQEIDKLIKLIQIDIKAQESTLDPSHLQQIMAGLFKVQMCGQVKNDSDLLLRDMHDLYSPPSLSPLPPSSSPTPTNPNE